MRIPITIEFRDGKAMIPHQEDVENIAIDTKQDTRNIYFDPIELCNHIRLEWSNTDEAWIILCKG